MGYSSMQFYLFAANLFTLTAFLLGLSSFSRSSTSWRLMPLFFLVVTQSISLIIMLAASADGEPGEAAARSLAALAVFSAVCLVWALIDGTTLSAVERRLGGVAAGVALFLSVFPLIPEWPVPFEIHSIIITMFGSLLIVVGQKQTLSWLHLLAPFLMALAALFSLLEWTSLAWGGNLLAYALLIGALHMEQILSYQMQQLQTARVNQHAMQLNQERQRILDSAEILSAVPSLADSPAHITRSVAHLTGAERVALLFLAANRSDQVHLGALYPAEHARGPYQSVFALSQSSLLNHTLNRLRQQLATPDRHRAELKQLYGLLDWEQIGPTLLQPLVVHGQAVGVLIVGNPVAGVSFGGETRLLCRAVAPQVAMTIEAYRQYHQLETRLDSFERWPVEALAEKKPLPDSSDGLKSNRCITILEALSEGVVVSTLDGRVWLVNRAAEQILNRPREALIGQPIGTIYGQIDSSETIEQLASDFSRRSEPLPTFYEDEERAIRGQLVPWRDVDKEWLGIVAVFKDVTNSGRF